MSEAIRTLATNLTRDFALSAVSPKASKQLVRLSEAVNSAVTALTRALHQQNSPTGKGVKESFGNLGLRLLEFLKKNVNGNQISTFLETLVKSKNDIEKNAEYWKDIFPFDQIDNAISNPSEIANAVKQAIPKELISGKNPFITINERKAFMAYCLLRKYCNLPEIQKVVKISPQTARRYYANFIDEQPLNSFLTHLKAKWFMWNNQNSYECAHHLAQAVENTFGVSVKTTYRWLGEHKNLFPKFYSPTIVGGKVKDKAA